MIQNCGELVLKKPAKADSDDEKQRKKKEKKDKKDKKEVSHDHRAAAARQQRLAEERKEAQGQGCRAGR